MSAVLPDSIFVPSMAGPGVLPTRVLLGWGIAALAISVADEPCWSLAAALGARARRGNVTRVSFVAGAGLVSIGAVAGPAWVGVMVSTAAFLGIGLVSAAILGVRISWFPGTAHLIVFLGSGGQAFGGAKPWFWFAFSGTESVNAVISTILCIVGILTWSRSATWHRQVRLTTPSS
ncbi:MAG: hypothetical protein WAW88_02335 [Nocardioides sp.]